MLQTPPKTSPISTTIQTASSPRNTKPHPPEKGTAKTSKSRKQKPDTSKTATGAAKQSFVSRATKNTSTGEVDWGGWEDFDYHGTEENYYRGEEDFYGGGRDFDYYGQWEMNLDISIRARRESGAKDKTTKTKRKPKAKEVIAESTERDLAREFKILDLEEVSTGIDRLKSDLDREHKGGTVAKPRLFELGCPYPPDALYVPFASGGRSSRRRGKGSYFVRGGLENLGMRKDRELARKLISDLGILEDVAKGAD